MPVPELLLLLEQKVCGVEISGLPCLASGHNSNLASEDMADIRRQGIAVDDDNEPDTKNISVLVKTPSTQLEEGKSLRSEGIIFPRQSNNLHNTNAAVKNYTREEVMNMTKLELFLILFPVDYLKEILTPKMNKILKHPMELGEFIWWMGCWLYMG